MHTYLIYNQLLFAQLENLNYGCTNVCPWILKTRRYIEIIEIYIHLSIYTHTHTQHTHTHTYIYIYMYIYILIFSCIFTYLYIYAHKHKKNSILLGPTCLVMVQVQFFFTKKKTKAKIGRPEHSLTQHPLLPLTSQFWLSPQSRPSFQSGRHMCNTPK